MTAGAAGDLLERTLLDLYFGSGAPATLYAALFSAAPSDSGGGTELSGSGYARVAVTNDTTNFPAASTTGGVTTKPTGADITFPAATADWLSAVAMAFMDAASGGNLIAWATLTTAKTVLNGQTAYFPAGLIVLGMD